MIDRALRPLFPEDYLCDVQVLISLLSSDAEVIPDALACLAASAALAVSDIPIQEIISEVRIGRKNGEFIVNPTRTELAECDLEFIIAATEKNIMMVEGEAKECQEEDLVKALEIGHEAIKIQIQAQKNLANQVGSNTKREYTRPYRNEELDAKIVAFAKDKMYAISSAASAKHARSDAFDALKKEVKEAGICFLHAPLFHPALKTVGPIRRNLGLRTFFNMLGPIVNPAQPKYQLIGVYSLEMARMYSYLMQSLGKEFTLIHSLDGYDEISLTTDTKVISNKGEFIMTPYQLGKRKVFPEELHGGNSVEAAATLFKKIIQGKGSWSQNSVVLANAAMALNVTGQYEKYELAFQAAVNSLESGAANRSLENLIRLQS